jgi:hypothetical protein
LEILGEAMILQNSVMKKLEMCFFYADTHWS